MLLLHGLTETWSTKDGRGLLLSHVGAILKEAARPAIPASCCVRLAHHLPVKLVRLCAALEHRHGVSAALWVLEILDPHAAELLGLLLTGSIIQAQSLQIGHRLFPIDCEQVFHDGITAPHLHVRVQVVDFEPLEIPWIRYFNLFVSSGKRLVWLRKEIQNFEDLRLVQLGVLREKTVEEVISAPLHGAHFVHVSKTGGPLRLVGRLIVVVDSLEHVAYGGHGD